MTPVSELARQAAAALEPEPSTEPDFSPEPPFDAPEPEPEPSAPEPSVDDAPASEQALARTSTDLVSRAKAHLITDPTTFERAGEMLQWLKDQQRRIEEFFEADIQRAHAAWKGLTTKRAGFVDPLKEAITVLSSRYATFSREEKARADAERRRRELEAQKAEQDRLRQEAEARAADARATEEAALAATTREEAEELRATAERLSTDAAELRQEAATVQAPVLVAQPSVAPPKGTTVRANWTFEVDDKVALIKAVAAGKVSPEALLANETYLRNRAKADKDTIVIPGVRFFDQGSVAHRRAR